MSKSSNTLRLKRNLFGERYTLIGFWDSPINGSIVAKVQAKSGELYDFPIEMLKWVTPMTPQRLRAIIIGGLIGATIGYFSAQLVIGFLR